MDYRKNTCTAYNNIIVKSFPPFIKALSTKFYDFPGLKAFKKDISLRDDNKNIIEITSKISS